MKKSILAFFAISFSSTAIAQVAVESLPQSSLVPGGIAVVATGGEAVSGSYRDQRILLAEFANEQFAVIGIPLDVEPGIEQFSLRHASGEQSFASFEVGHKQYRERHLTITNERQVNPNAQDMERITRESAEMRRAFSTWSDALTPAFAMSQPVAGVRSSSFGSRSFFNGQPRNPHSGMDIAAPEGTPIHAPAPGVILATGNFFFNGNTIIMDHGHGLISLYCHMNTIDVEPGAVIAAGEQIGRVGSTGRVTGPHLHWSVNLNNTRVDPELFLGENPTP